MQIDDEVKTVDRNNSMKSGKNNIDNVTMNRRKRINRIKTAIILIIIILLILPTICCIVLGLQLGRLQKQVDDLAALHGQNRTSDVRGNNYVYAAVKSDNVTNNNDANANPTESVINDDNQELQNDNLNTKQEQTNDTVSADIKDDIKKDKTSKTSNLYAGKKVYLTFDDGPSEYTGKILDILADYNIKATFFVIGKTDKQSKNLYKRIVDEGHTLGVHSYSHDYEKIYKSIEDFDKDFTKLWELLYDTTGYKPFIYRFPGGSDNLVNENGMDSFIRYLNNKDIEYFDWNVVNGDATKIKYTKDQLINNVLNGIALKDRSIVLMHDTQTKKGTVDSLPELINALITGGAQILPIDKNVKPIQMIEADKVN